MAKEFSLEEALGTGTQKTTEFSLEEALGQKPQDSGFLRQVADVPLGIGKGALTGVRMVADAFGAGSRAAEAIKGAEGYVSNLMSAQAKNDEQEISRIMKDAEDKGVLDQVQAAFKAFSVAPVDLLSQGVGTAGVGLLGMLGGKVLGAGRLGLGAISAATGAGMGAGSAKGGIYEEVKAALKESGVDEAKAEAAAIKAQEYGGKNLDQILLSAGLGAISGASGVEGVAKRILSRAATKEAGEAAAKGAFRETAEGAVKTAATEGLPEYVQGSQEQLAKNIALQREGFETPTMRGVVGSGVLEGLAGAGLGSIAGGTEAGLRRQARGEAQRILAEEEKVRAEQEATRIAAEEAEKAKVPPLALGSEGVFTPVALPDGSVAMTREELAQYEEEQFRQKYEPQKVEQPPAPEPYVKPPSISGTTPDALLGEREDPLAGAVFARRAAAEPQGDVPLADDYAFLQREKQRLLQQDQTPDTKKLIGRIDERIGEVLKRDIERQRRDAEAAKTSVFAQKELPPVESRDVVVGGEELATLQAPERFPETVIDRKEKQSLARLEKMREQPAPPESDADKKIAELEKERNKIKSTNLYGELIGKLAPGDVSDISPDIGKNLRVKGGRGGAMLSDIVSSGTLDNYLPPDKRPGSITFDEQDATEYIKDKLRNQNHLTFDAEVQARQLDNEIDQLRKEAEAPRMAEYEISEVEPGEAASVERSAGEQAVGEVTDIRYQRSPVSGKSIGKQQTQSVVDAVKGQWANAPEVVVAENMDDPAIPAEVRAHNKEAMQKGAKGSPRGFFYKGKAYVIADAATSPTQVIETLFHESLGHYGLRGTFGPEMGRVLADVVKNRKADVEAKAKQYGLDVNSKEDMLEAAEEVLAEMAQTKPGLSFVKRAIAVIRNFLRDLGLPFKMSNDDIIEKYILPARRYVTDGGSRYASRRTGTHASGQKTDSDKFVSDGARADAEMLANLSSGEAFENEGFGGFNTPTRRMVQLAVLRLAQNPEIADSIVSFIPVDVVNMLGVKDFSANTLLNNPSVLKNLLPINGNQSVSIRSGASTQLVLAAAKAAAKHMGIDLRFDFAPGSTAKRAIEKNPILLQEQTSARGAATVSIGGAGGSPRGGEVELVAAKGAGGKGQFVSPDGLDIIQPARAFVEKGKRRKVEGKPAAMREPAKAPPTEEADIRYQREAEPAKVKPTRQNIFGEPVLGTWSITVDPKMELQDGIIYKLLDKNIDVKRIVEAVKSTGKQIASQWNPYLQEELYHGRTANASQEFQDKEWQPLLQDMGKMDVTIGELEKYLLNRHAEDYNRIVAERNPDRPEMQDGGSSVKTADARKYLAELSPDLKKKYEALAKRVDAITKGTRKLLVDTGYEKAETVKGWEEAFPNYVPLMREEGDFDYNFGSFGTGRGFDVRRDFSRSAMGSKRNVVDIIGNVIAARNNAIALTEKNRVAQAVYGLALEAPNPDFWMAINPEAEKVPQDAIDELRAMGLDEEAVKYLMKEPKQRVLDPKKDQIVSRINTKLRENDYVLATRINGEKRYVFFNPKDPRANRAATALKNLGAQDLGAALGLVAKVTRWMASVNTQYNPIFGPYNFLRDLQSAALQLSTTELAGQQKEIGANVVPALRVIYSSLRKRRKGEAATGEMADLWKEFQREGGQTGFKDNFSRTQDRTEALLNEMQKISEGKVKANVRAVFDWLSDYNDSLENAVRLSAYKVAKEKFSKQGFSDSEAKQKAASLAKNLTVNFNRKGDVATQMGALYAFFNASMQGTARMVETLKGPMGKRIMAGGLLLGSMQAALLAAAGFDDEEPPEFIRSKNIVIPTGDGDYVAFPMPLGFHVIPGLSRILTEWTLSGFDDTARRVTDLTGLFLDAFNPIGNAGWSVQTITPTALDPLVALGENKDWTGKPISKEDIFSLRPTPGYTRAREGANVLAKGLAEFLNYASGGTKYQPGVLSPTPEQIEYLVGQAFGGVGREAIKLSTTIDKTITGEELPPYKIPLYGRFVGKTKSSAAESNRFYKNMQSLNKLDMEIKGRRENREPIGDFMKDNPQARLLPMANKTYKDVQALRKRRAALVERDAPRESVQAVEKLITRKMQMLNDRVRALEESN